MMYFYSLFLLAITISGAEVWHPEKPKIKAPQNLSVKRCIENPDRSYNRHQVLERLAQILNQSIPEYAHVFGNGFYVEDERGVGFFIYDLTDPSNKGTPLYDCVDFRNDHIYHFAPIRQHYSISHIVILEDGRLKVFKAINCRESRDKLEDVISYVTRKLRSDKHKDEIIDRVRHYRRYGFYTKVDDSSLTCQEVE